MTSQSLSNCGMGLRAADKCGGGGGWDISLKKGAFRPLIAIELHLDIKCLWLTDFQILNSFMLSMFGDMTS